jgi:hypothetical protein
MIDVEISRNVLLGWCAMPDAETLDFLQLESLELNSTPNTRKRRSGAKHCLVAAHALPCDSLNRVLPVRHRNDVLQLAAACKPCYVSGVGRGMSAFSDRSSRYLSVRLVAHYTSATPVMLVGTARWLAMLVGWCKSRNFPTTTTAL